LGIGVDWRGRFSFVSLSCDVLTSRTPSSSGEYDYFRFYVEETNATVQFTLTPLSGDPDILVSIDEERPTLARPGQPGKFWSGLAAGLHVDQITVTIAPVGAYYIAVFGARNSSYTVIAHITAHGSGRGNMVVRT